MSKTVCMSCEHQKIPIDLLPCAICVDIQNGTESQWTPKEREQ